MKENIGVIGVGKLGLSFALLCAQKGFKVLGSDVNLNYVQSLNDGSYQTREPMIEDYLTTTRFSATTSNREVIEFADTIFLFVPTPSTPTGEYDHRYIEQVVTELEDLGDTMQNKILVIGCTVMPGYTKIISDRLEAIGYEVAYNPEFIAQGDIINGLKRADMVLVGTESDKVAATLFSIYGSIMEIPVNMKVMSPTAAEITKIAINCFLTTKISFANMIGEVAIRSGVEDQISLMLEAIGDDTRIGKKYIKYGFGYGGPCLPRDNNALAIHMDYLGIPSSVRVPEYVDRFNEWHNEFLFQYFTSNNPDKEVPFIFPQLSYKKGTEQITESQQLRLCKRLLIEGYKIIVTEPKTPVLEIAISTSQNGSNVQFRSDSEKIDGYYINI